MAVTRLFVLMLLLLAWEDMKVTLNKKKKSERKVRIGEELTIDIKLSLVLEEVEVLKICYWNVCCTKRYLL